MKLNTVILIVFLLSSSCYSFSQATDRILPDTLQTAISGQWKYQLGDNPLWSSEEFDDSKWITTSFSNSFKDSIPAGHQILWFRLTIPAGVVKNDSLLAIIIEQFGASEIYVNSKLVKQLGRIITPQRFSYYNPHRSPIPVILKSEQQNILAIRFATDMPGSEWIISRLNVPPVFVKLQDLNVVLAESEASVGEKRVQTGISFITGIFGFLFLLIFLFYPREKLNLFFALFNLFLLINAISINFMETGHFNLNVRALFTPGLNLISRLIGMSLLLFMLYALNKMRPFFWWFIGWVLLLDFPLTLILPVEYMNISQALRTAIVPISVWVMYHSFKSSRREDILIGFVAFTMILVNVSFFLTRFTEFDFSVIVTTLAPAMFYLIAIFYLAIRYAKTNKSLQQQIKQVQLLSLQTLRQEKEKQAILSSQKNLLEQEVQERTAELYQQKKELQTTLEHLKDTQLQLIQREKMASLGEVTAGIAHEIQNPLNFVNNFSEVNRELVDELKNELATGNQQQAIEIADNIKANEEKINQHGKRADAIVKGMLQHSRISTGQKEPTDINALADEYLRLAYHGLKAKDKSFNSTIKTDLDVNVGKINVNPQDIARVILNLINNAFYAVNEKQKQSLNGYEPIVTVTTKKLTPDKIEIQVKDNGNGIPQKVLDKIFQPFFTTKPTGQGTGLGLSLAYDIVTKGHGGELKVETNEGMGSTFIIELPAN